MLLPGPASTSPKSTFFASKVMVSLRWCESLAKAPLHAITRGDGLARDGFPIPGDEAALEGCPGALPISCADTGATVAIIKQPTATRAAKSDPASIIPPGRR